MVQLKILTGKKAGTEWSARHFPFSVGRASSDDVQLDDAGVWEKHFEISPQLPDGFILHASNERSVIIGGVRKAEGALKNGDIIEFGATKVQFWLAPPKQKRLSRREIAMWVALAAVVAAQLGLLWWLMK